MPREVICPTCGRMLSVDEPIESPDPDSPPAAARTTEVVVPSTMTSADDLETSNSTPTHGPILGGSAQDDPDLTVLSPGSSAKESESPRDEPVGTNGLPRGAALTTAGPLESLDLDTLLGPRDAKSVRSDEDDLEAWQQPARWPWILLASYASVLTLVLIWMLSTGRVQLRSRTEVETATLDPGFEIGEQADRSEKVEPAPPIAPNRLTSLGRPLRVGSLEFTPLNVQTQRVELERARLSGADSELRDGGADALVLSIRLRNLSDDAIFSPLDEAFIRERDRGSPESFIETAGDGRIYIYPLAVHSEWSIIGQSFPVLKPGESAETIVVSSAEALVRATQSMTWRLRLRTGLEETDVVGVSFRMDEIDRDAE
jgi:hypothetical protein